MKYVPLECVTLSVGPFGDDHKFLISSVGFHTPEQIFIVSLEQVASARVCNVQFYMILSDVIEGYWRRKLGNPLPG